MHDENTIVTLNEPSHFNFSAYTRPPPYRMLLFLGLASLDIGEGQNSLFTHFIKTSELSGPLYISPDLYYTQSMEYSLEAIFQGHNDSW